MCGKIRIEPKCRVKGPAEPSHTAIIAAAQGIGFAIPATTASWVIPQLLAHGRVRRAWLGLAGRSRPLHRRVAQEHGISAEGAVEVLSVVSESPADRGGLAVGDWLISFADQPTPDIDALHRLLAEWPIGERARVVTLRDGRRQEIDVTPVESPTSG